MENKITEEYIKSRIVDVKYYCYPESTVTICFITLDNGFVEIGKAACVDPANFNLQIGENISYKAAFEKLWALFGFLLTEKRYLESKNCEETARK